MSKDNSEFQAPNPSTRYVESLVDGLRREMDKEMLSIRHEIQTFKDTHKDQAKESKEQIEKHFVILNDHAAQMSRLTQTFPTKLNMEDSLAAINQKITDLQTKSDKLEGSINIVRYLIGLILAGTSILITLYAVKIGI